MKMFEMLEELTKQLGEEHPQVKQNWDTFFKLASPYLKFDGTPSLRSIKFDTNTTRQLLGFQATPSISFTFIENLNVRMQLQLDNVNMEGLCSNPKEIEKRTDDLARFKEFCTYACYQVEELLNYYFVTNEQAYQKLVNSSVEKDKRFQIKPSDSEEKTREKEKNKQRTKKRLLSSVSNVSIIQLSDKISEFVQKHYSGPEFFEKRELLHSVRKIRNEELHRCSVIEKDENKVLENYNALLEKIKNKDYQKSKEDWALEMDAKFVKFIRSREYNVVRSTLQDVANNVQSGLQTETIAV